GHAGGAADEGVAADAAALLDRGEPAHDHVVAEPHVAAQRGAIGQGDVVADLAVVSDVRADIEGAVVANRGDSAAEGGPAVHGHLLADQVAFADDQLAAVALLVAGVLRRRAEHCERPHLAALTDLGLALDHHVRAQGDAGRQLHVRAHGAIGADFRVGGDFRARRDQRRRVDAHAGGTSINMAANSASAATLSPTSPRPLNLNTSPLARSTSTGMRSMSPGFTGLRKRQLSTEMNMMPLPRVSMSSDLLISTPPLCSIASMISTPGITGWPGKWPTKNGSFIVTALMPTIERCGL